MGDRQLFNETREAVRQRYAQIALRVLQPETKASASCCGSSTCCGSGERGPISGDLYDATQLAAVPETAALASLGCGNPTALADLHEGEVVLDLGSGGGIDVLLSAKQVGPTGRAFGLEMTDEMLALARRNADEAALRNVEFLKGRIEEVPLPDNSVDVIISNCVINLSTEKDRVLAEAFRVLRPGGRFAVSDVIVDGSVPRDLRTQVELWVGCIAGALDRQDYVTKLEEAGFVNVSIEPTRFYTIEDMGDAALTVWLAAQPEPEQICLGRAFMSAFIRAQKAANLTGR